MRKKTGYSWIILFACALACDDSTAPIGPAEVDIGNVSDQNRGGDRGNGDLTSEPPDISADISGPDMAFSDSRSHDASSDVGEDARDATSDLLNPHANEGEACGSRGLPSCNEDLYCDWARNDCGVTDGGGKCAIKPDGCPEFIEYTCGCDGMIYTNSCEAAASGVDENDRGGCTNPDQTFRCGQFFCDTSSEYCTVNVSDIGNEPDVYRCDPLPAACGSSPSCTCLESVPCGRLCSDTTDGGWKVVCPGG
jgi:hypothetical protein